MNIWCLFEARAGDPLSGRRGVGGNLPDLPPANFRHFLRWTCHRIPVELQSYVSILRILDNCQLLYFFLCAVAVVELGPDSTSQSISTTRRRLSQRILIGNRQSLANQVREWPQCYFDIPIAKKNWSPGRFKSGSPCKTERNHLSEAFKSSLVHTVWTQMYCILTLLAQPLVNCIKRGICIVSREALFLVVCARLGPFVCHFVANKHAAGKSKKTELSFNKAREWEDEE